MKFTKLPIQDVILMEPKIFQDDRGLFFESLNQKLLADAIGFSPNFVQENQSISKKNVLRGLHYQASPKAQDKLVRVLSGVVFDVAVDIRQHSPTFGQWVGELLTGENKKQLWIPKGFAHGFLTLSETADFLYKVTDFYAPEQERSILWNDATLGIQWPLQTPPCLSEKDLRAIAFREAEMFV